MEGDHRIDLPSCEDHGLKNCDPYCAKCYRLLRDKYDAALLQNGAWEKLVRAAADQIYAFGKQLRTTEEAATGTTLQVLATEMHRECQVIKGDEEPLPHAGERLTEKPKC